MHGTINIKLMKVLLLPVSCFLKQREEPNDFDFHLEQFFKER